MKKENKKQALGHLKTVNFLLSRGFGPKNIRFIKHQELTKQLLNCEFGPKKENKERVLDHLKTVNFLLSRGFGPKNKLTKGYTNVK